jgi:hypothetical protein
MSEEAGRAGTRDIRGICKRPVLVKWPLNSLHLLLTASSHQSSDMDVPDFDNLPPVEGMPAGCAWGVFDKDGKKDLFGTLNHLTPEVVKAAAAEVKDGVSFSLKYFIHYKH